MRRMTADILTAIMPGGISADDFAATTRLDRDTSAQILEDLLAEGVGTRSAAADDDDSTYVFDASDRLSAALVMIGGGTAIDDVAPHLDWRSFEGLAARILDSKGFDTERNLIMTKPRMEIDVVGTNNGIALLIDCKHWSRHNTSALRTAVKRQVARTRRYVSQAAATTAALPVIVTLYSERLDFIDRVPIVPIQRFSSFVDEFYGNLDGMRVIEKDLQ